MCALFKFLKDTLGSTWTAAATARTQSNSLLMGGSAEGRRAKGPWLSVMEVLRSPDFDTWIRKHLREKVTWDM